MSSPLSMVGVHVSLPVSPTAALEPRLVSDWCKADTEWCRDRDRKARVTMNPGGRLWGALRHGRSLCGDAATGWEGLLL